MSDVRALINEIRADATQYGKLVDGNKITWREALAIIRYYEGDGESEAVRAAEEKAADAQRRLDAANGKAGGLTKRIKKLEEALEEAQVAKEQKRKLTRIANAAAEVAAYVAGSEDLIDADGDALRDHPLLVRLVQELGE